MGWRVRGKTQLSVRIVLLGGPGGTAESKSQGVDRDPAPCCSIMQLIAVSDGYLTLPCNGRACPVYDIRKNPP